MIPWKPNEWTEARLEGLLGERESATLEFKSAGILDKGKKDFVDDLSREISAFANCDGGIIVIGIAEGKGKPKAAEQLGGITMAPNAAIQSPEQFQQILDDCVKPFLPGIRLKPIRLTNDDGKWAMVVYVPEGSTAYQAKDLRYYGRSEFEAKAMPDHEVRLRMNRGRVPQARLELPDSDWRRITAEQDFQERSALKQRREREWEAGHGRLIRDDDEIERLRAPQRDYDEFEFQFAVVNTGEVTIRDFLLHLYVDVTLEGAALTTYPPTAEGCRFRFAEIEHTMPNQKLPERKVFPGDRIPFPHQKWSLRVPAGATIPAGAVMVRWTIFLDDQSPIENEIDLAAVFHD